MSTKLLFVVNTDSFFISHRLPIAIEAMRKGYEVHVAARISYGMKLLHDKGLIVHSLNLDRASTGLLSNCITFFQIFRLYKIIKPDIIHLVTIKPIIFGGLAARLAAIPCIVVAISGLGFIFYERGLKAIIRRWLICKFYFLVFNHKNLKVIFQNKDDLDVLVKATKVSEKKCALIYGSGVDLDLYSFTPLNYKTPIVMLASRLLVSKGVREFVQAIRILKKNGSNARFVLVGTIDPENPASLSSSELESWNSEHIIELWGQCSNMCKIFSSAYMVVLPSYGEGLPKVLIEAAACGRAIVTTDVPGCRDAIVPGVTGLLVSARDSLSLASAIKQLLDEPEKCVGMGKAARKRAERMFDVRCVVEKHIQIYKELIILV